MFASQPWGTVPWTGEKALDSSILASSVESTSATEASDRLANIAPAQSEVGTAVSAQAVTPQKDANEAAFANDAPNVLLMYAWRYMDEPTTASDTEAVTLVVARAEPVTATEVSDRVATMAPVAAEVATAADTPNRALTALGNQADAATAVDVETGSMNPSVAINEYIPTKLVPGSYPYIAADLLLYSRASSATYLDGSGNLQTASANAVRFQGGQMLIEGPATNVVRNNSMTGAASGSPGTKPNNWQGTLGTTAGVAIRISATGTENGIPYIDLEFNGTATSTADWYLLMEDLTRQAAASGDTWTSSVFTKMVSGTIPGTQPILVTSGRDVSNIDTEHTTTNLNTGTGALSSQRVAATQTMAVPGTVSVGPYLMFSLVSGNLYLFTMRVGGPQLELGASATSLIQTTTANVTRAGDDAWPLPVDTKGATLDAVASRVDSVTATDAASAQQVVVQAETGSVTDTQVGIPLLAWADSSPATDAQDVLLAAVASRTDALTPTDQTAATSILPVDRSDLTPIADNEAVILIAAVSATDANTATDTESVVAGMSAARTEPSTLVDTSNGANITFAGRTDTGTVTDTTDRSMTANPVQAEVGAATDTAGNTMASSASGNEAGFANETNNGGPVTFVDLVDIIGVTATAGRTVIVPGAKTEPATATDTPGKTLTADGSVSDFSTPGHTQASQTFASTGRTDNAPITDTQTQQTAMSASRTDTSPASDTNVGSTHADVTRSDTGSASEASNRTASLQRQQDEPAQAADVPSTLTVQQMVESTTLTDTYYKFMVAEVDVKESTTPTHTQSSASLFNRWLQEQTYAVDLASVQAFMQAVQADAAKALELATVVDFTVSVAVHEVATITDAVDGVMLKMVQALGAANAQDLQAAAVTMVRTVQELNPALDLVAAVKHAAVVVSEGAAASDWCAIVIPVGQVDGTDATDTCAVFMYETNRMLLLFDKDCHC